MKVFLGIFSKDGDVFFQLSIKFVLIHFVIIVSVNFLIVKILLNMSWVVCIIILGYTRKFTNDTKNTYLQRKHKYLD